MKLSERERMLASIVAGILFILLNLLLVSAFVHRNSALRAQLANQRRDWSNMQLLLGDQSLWATRNAALNAKQPSLTNENAAPVELFDTIKDLARKHSITISNPVLNTGVEKSSWYRSISVTIDTSSSWPQLISFLYEIQKPDQFLVCEQAHIEVDQADSTKMAAHFKIARWYAP
jgi:hypothetical protein